MVLTHVYLYLNLDEYPKELATLFGFRTRYVCNFLERHLRPLKFRAEGFSKIAVQGRHQPLNDVPIVSENSALPTVAFDQARYESLSPGEEHEFFVAMLEEGLDRCAQQHQIPLAELKAAISEFRQGGYKNEWTDQTKLLRPSGLRASLIASLDAERFQLRLTLDKGGAVVFDRVILETKPDELIFGHRFKEVALEHDAVVIKDKFGRPTFSVHLDSLP